jgi:hypothetical protein
VVKSEEPKNKALEVDGSGENPVKYTELAHNAPQLGFGETVDCFPVGRVS